MKITPKKLKNEMNIYKKYYIIEDDKYVFINKPLDKEHSKLFRSIDWKGKELVYFDSNNQSMVRYIKEIKRERDIAKIYAACFLNFLKETLILSFLAALLFWNILN